MNHPGALLKASFLASKAFFRLPAQSKAPRLFAVAEVPAVVVPIRSIGSGHAERINAHLMALSSPDRYLRFGYAASNAQIERYVAGLDFERDEIFGIYNRRLELIALAHLAFSTDPELKSCAEFGVSVLAHARGRGYGARLFDRAAMHSRNEGVQMMFIHALSENTVMLNIARKAGAAVERDGSETEAYLKLQPADIDSRMSEMLDEQIAQTDYRLKVQAKKFWDFLALLQEIRRGVRDSRDRMRM
ncbi:MAG: GCN5-related N-acetyltransferase [Polaromonas sp.]|jgi:GNAT superfamily N-acetyltransferase|nr:GCN5-related N-acetyltransferase [Polaromonas sp.]